MTSVRLMILLSCISTAASNPEGPECYDCPDVHHPNDCNQRHRCGHDEFCATEITGEGHDLKWKFLCKKDHECPGTVMAGVMGRKRPAPAGPDPHHPDPHHPDPHHPDHFACQECCSTDLCNRNLCNITGVTHHGAPMCYDCPEVNHPNDCIHSRRCGDDEVCSTEIIMVGPEQKWKFLCKKSNECPRTVLIGRKREPGHHEPPPQQFACRDCCSTDNCNRNLCQPYIATTTAAVTTTGAQSAASTPATTAGQTTVVDLLCFDIDPPTASCQDLASQGHCATVPGSQYEFMKLRCRKTCGFCHVKHGKKPCTTTEKQQTINRTCYMTLSHGCDENN